MTEPTPNPSALAEPVPTEPESKPSYERPSPRLAPGEFRRVLPGAVQVVIPFEEHAERSGHQHWDAHPHVAFLPLGLLVFDAAPGARVHGVYVGNMFQNIADYAGVPAQYFEAGKSFEQISELAARGELGETLPERLLLELDHCEWGCHVRLVTSGKVGGACLWGVACDGRHPARDVRIWPDRKKNDWGAPLSYRGEVVDLTVVGSRLRFGCSTETEAAAVELVKTFLCGQHGPRP